MVLLAQQVLVGRSWCGRSPWAEPQLAAGGCEKEGVACFRVASSSPPPSITSSWPQGARSGYGARPWQATLDLPASRKNTLGAKGRQRGDDPSAGGCGRGGAGG